MSVALGTAAVGGSGIAHADDVGGKPAVTAPSDASASSGTEVHTPKPKHPKKTGAATTPKVADPQSDSTKTADTTSSESTPPEQKGDQSGTGAAAGQDPQSADASGPKGSDPSDPAASEKSDAAGDVQDVADTAAGASTATALHTFAVAENKSSTARQLSVAAVPAPSLAALPNPLALIGAVITYDLHGAKNLMNPLIAGALGVYHLQTGINELKTLHLIGGALDLVSGVLALATPILKAVPGGSLLIPVTAVLGSTTATINTIGQGLLHW